jgi:hypothetical protein
MDAYDRLQTRADLAWQAEIENTDQAYQEACWRDFPPDSDPIPEGSLD